MGYCLTTANKTCLWTLLFLWLCSGLAIAGSEALTDTENCLLCHRYPAMGRYDKSGSKRIFYVNAEKFASSVHARLKCKSCHINLDKIPHTGVEKVNCTTLCHITEPSSNREFSHQNMAEKFASSVHSSGPADKPKAYAEDLPTCKYCHQNRMYVPYAGESTMGDAILKETLTRCVGCHTNQGWAEAFYSHFTHRMKRRRTQEEVVALCTSCHEDAKKMARHGIESIETFKDTFHWTQVKYGVKNAPDCISCHVPGGLTTHEIRPQSDPLSAVNTANRVSTCSNQGGVQACHPAATVQFASGRVHAYGAKARLAMANRTGVGAAYAKEVTSPEILEKVQNETPTADLAHYRILSLIKLAYRLIIPGVVGFMFVHNFLDFLKTRRKHKGAHGSARAEKRG